MSDVPLATRSIVSSTSVCDARGADGGVDLPDRPLDLGDHCQRVVSESNAAWPHGPICKGAAPQVSGTQRHPDASGRTADQRSHRRPPTTPFLSRPRFRDGFSAGRERGGSSSHAGTPSRRRDGYPVDPTFHASRTTTALCCSSAVTSGQWRSPTAPQGTDQGQVSVRHQAR